MSIKVFCDRCGAEMPLSISGQHDMWLDDADLGKLSIIVIVREWSEPGQSAEHKHICVKCLRELVQWLLEITPGDSNYGEKTKSELAGISSNR